MENKNTKEIKVRIDGQEWKDEIEKTYKKLSQKAKIDGFRPGKAPKEIFMKKYGESALYFDVAHECIQKAYIKLLIENRGLEVVAKPLIDIASCDKDGVTFKFTVTLRPEVKLGDYKNLSAKKEEVEVTDEEIQNGVNEMLNYYAENVCKEGKIAEGDIAIIDFEGFKDGVPFDGGKGENYSLEIGSKTFIPGFEEQLIGLQAGDIKDINLVFPEDYPSDELKGQPVVFKVKVNEVKETIVPELNEEFFKDLDMEGINSKETFENKIKESITARKNNEADNKYIDALIEELLSKTEIDIPQAMIAEEQESLLKQFEEKLKENECTLKEYYKYTMTSEESLKEKMKEEAIKRVKTRLILEEIIKLEKIEVTDEEALEQASALAEQYKMSKEEFIKHIGGIETIKYDMEFHKAIEVLKGE